MRRIIVKLGLVVAAICPIAIVVGLALWHFMPSCTVGSSPAKGCVLLGFDISWLMQYLIWFGFMGSLILVPIGLGISILGAVASMIGGGKASDSEP
ncbi:MAG: hypothetical protein K8F26_06455 [Thiobacillus sp.]|jgi:hypothetical protein|nr:hypothetical protein [Thiobacillus sp.]